MIGGRRPPRSPRFSMAASASPPSITSIPDAITREEMQDVFLGLWHEQHTTTLLVTHYVEEALYLGQKIVLMAANPGRIARVFDNPLSGSRERRSSQAFFEMSRTLREEIRTLRVQDETDEQREEERR
mgnify:CR=1 FL=1